MCSLAKRAAGTAWALVTLVLFAPTVAHGQTDYVNTDLNRPLRVHDAQVMERHALELHFAPWSLLRRRGVADEYTIDTELGWGAWRHTQVELGAPVTVSRKANGSRGAALSGVDVHILHQLNSETLGLPALAVGGDLDIPVRGDGRARFTATAAATRTMALGRVHLNARYTTGPAPNGGDVDGSRWLGGVAYDRVFPLHFLLVSADVFAARPFTTNVVTWHAGAGVRWQVSPAVALDAGAERGLSAEREWRWTLGAARVFGVRRLIRGAR